MLGLADYASGELKCEPGEINDAQWFSKDHLPALPPAGTISRYLIDTFLESLGS